MRAVLVIAAWAFFACALSGEAAGAAPAKPAGGSAATGTRLPTPPYPYQARQQGITGSGVCRVTFDAAGHAAKVMMTKSTGSKILDENTENFARKNWTGKPDTQASVPVIYELPKSASTSTIKTRGSGICRVTFDASGRVSTAVMTTSTGSAVLDKNTVDFARANWKGPPNATRDVPVTYQSR